MTWPILQVRLRSESDVVVARQRARQIAALVGLESQDQVRVATAVSEIVRNAVTYGGGDGMAAFELDAGASPRTLVVCVDDHGPGIADLDAVLEGRYQSTTGMGLGIRGARRLMDGFAIETGPAGVRVTMHKRLPARAPPLDRAQLSALVAGLRAEAAGNPMTALLEQNRELMESLEALHERQQELARLNTELEETNRGVVALYAELENASERVREAGDAKARFLSSMTHEFRTPLNSILALAQLLLDRIDGDLGTEQERQVDLIHQSAGTLSRMVDDLLDLAKAQAGRLEVHRSESTVGDLFAMLRGALRPLLTGDAVDLVFDTALQGQHLHTDEGKVAQILRNFISNALKYTERGEVRVSARMSGDGTILFTVQDTGIGIAPEHVDLVFDEFSQVPNRLQQRQKGTGLGLPLSRRLAELLGGTVGLASTPEVGSTFWLRLPIGVAVVGEVALAPAQDGVPAPARSAVSILVVDDDPVFRYVMRQWLSPMAELAEAPDGRAALACIGGLAPDLVVLDLEMPDLDGYQVLDGLVARGDPVPVVVCTAGHVGPNEVVRLGRAARVLSKAGLTRDVVERAVREILLPAGASS